MTRPNALVQNIEPWCIINTRAPLLFFPSSSSSSSFYLKYFQCRRLCAGHYWVRDHCLGPKTRRAPSSCIHVSRTCEPLGQLNQTCFELHLCWTCSFRLLGCAEWKSQHFSHMALSKQNSYSEPLKGFLRLSHWWELGGLEMD